MIFTLLATSTTLGNTFEQLLFNMFGSAELFGVVIILGFMLIMGISNISPKFMLMVASFLVVAFSFVYGGAIFTTMTVIIVLIYGYLVAKMIINAFSR